MANPALYVSSSRRGTITMSRDSHPRPLGLVDNFGDFGRAVRSQQYAWHRHNRWLSVLEYAALYSD